MPHENVFVDIAKEQAEAAPPGDLHPVGCRIEEKQLAIFWIKAEHHGHVIKFRLSEAASDLGSDVLAAEQKYVAYICYF